MSIPTPLKYIADFEKMGFGMFVHWGIYSQLGKSEWVYELEHMNMDDYKKLADTFTAADFNAEEWVLCAKEAGCKYITLTTRHHDGFSLYDTCGLSDFDVIHTPCGRDLIREFVNACNKHGISPFFYHTTLDWYNPDFKDNFDAYLDYLNASVEILCKNYGKIGGLWFDGNWSKPNADWKEARLYATIRKYQPEAIIIDNTGLYKRGQVGNPEIDSVAFERGRPTPMDREGMSKYLAAEMSQTVNDNWATARNDFNYKSPAELIRDLCHCRKIGANFLLNIGPLAQGALDPYQKELMKLIGRWNKIFGEAIYDGKPYPSYTNSKNFILKAENKLFIFCMNPPTEDSVNLAISNNHAGSCAFDNVTDTVKSIKWMDNDETLDFMQNGRTLSVYFTSPRNYDSFCVRVAVAELE